MTTQAIEEAVTEDEEAFDPAKHIRFLGGKEYLDVKWRVVWARRDHPDLRIIVEMMEHDPGVYSVFRATVTIPGDPDVVCVDYGSETKDDFHDYLEKSSTKAIGRALALLGYGTASLPDEGDRIADAPVERAPVERQPRRASQPRPSAPTQPASRPTQMRDPGGAATEAQINAIIKIAARKQITDTDLMAYVEQMYSSTLDQLNKGQASAIIQLIGDQSFTGFGGAAAGSPTERQPDPDPPLGKSPF